MIRNRIICFFLFILAMGLCFFENNTGTKIIAASAVLLPLISVGATYLCKKNIQLTIYMPETVEKREKAEICIRATTKRIPAVLKGNCCLHNVLTNEKISRIVIISEQKEMNLSFCSDYCGVVMVRIDNLKLHDCFGLVSFEVNKSASGYCLIRPECYSFNRELSLTDIYSQEGEQWSMNRAGNDPSETYGIREYLPGDSVHQIHWKLSEKTGKTMFRELGFPLQNRVLVFFDNSVENSDAVNQSLSACYEMFLSLSQQLLYNGNVHFTGWRTKEGESFFEIQNQHDFELLKKGAAFAVSRSICKEIIDCFSIEQKGSMNIIICTTRMNLESSLAEYDNISVLLTEE